MKQNLREAEEANVVIYAVQYNTLPQLPARLTQIADENTRAQVRLKLTKNYDVGSNYLYFLAEKTGGRMYRADHLSDVPQMFNAITDELGRQYSLGYYPKGGLQAGEKRDIRVKTTHQISSYAGAKVMLQTSQTLISACKTNCDPSCY